MPNASPEQLDAITSAIVRCCNPAKIILFGSQARGTAGRDSDIDLLIVDERPFSPSRSRRQAIGMIRRSLPRIGVPIDILLFDKLEVDGWKATTNHVIADAIREGKVLHDRS
jgi:predicted nucleotidyltransferase